MVRWDDAVVCGSNVVVLNARVRERVRYTVERYTGEIRWCWCCGCCCGKQKWHYSGRWYYCMHGFRTATPLYSLMCAMNNVQRSHGMELWCLLDWYGGFVGCWKWDVGFLTRGQCWVYMFVTGVGALDLLDSTYTVYDCAMTAEDTTSGRMLCVIDM